MVLLHHICWVINDQSFIKFLPTLGEFVVAYLLSRTMVDDGLWIDHIPLTREQISLMTQWPCILCYFVYSGWFIGMIKKISDDCCSLFHLTELQLGMCFFNSYVTSNISYASVCLLKPSIFALVFKSQCYLT